jgi:sensor domain CHASE-containing protein
MKNVKNYKQFEAKSFSDLSKMDKLKADVIIKNAHDMKNFIKHEIDIYKKYIRDYNLSDDLVEFLEEEIKYHEEILKSRKKWDKEKKDKIKKFYKE